MGLGDLVPPELRLRPIRCEGFEGDALIREGMEEGEAPGVEAEWGGGDVQGLGVAIGFAVGQVNGIADDGEAKLPEVGADLVGASGDGAGFDEGGVVAVLRIAFEDAEFGAGGEAIREIDVAGAGFARFGGDGGVARELIGCG